VTSAFFTDLSNVLDCVSTLIEPIFVVGDININLERPGDPTTVQFTDLLADRGLTCHVTSSTHERGGTLDVIATRDDLPPPPVEVVDVGLSDHRCCGGLRR